MKRTLGALCATLVLTAVPLHAQGVLLVQKETRQGKSTTRQSQIEKTRMRADSGDGTVMLFDGGKQVATMINTPKKTYSEMSKADLDKMKKELDGAMAQMQEAMKGMPAAQRQAMEAMMNSRGGIMGAAVQAVKLTYKQTGTDKVGQWSCTKYEGYSGQTKMKEICTVDPKDLGMTLADFEIVKQLADFMSALSPEVAAQMSLAGTGKDQDFSGYPVKETSFRGGAVDSVMELVEVKRDTFPASSYEVPSGFKKENLAGPRGR